MKILREQFYGRPTLTVSKELLGKYLIREIDNKILCGKIVETEAYTGIQDKAAHVYGGKTTPRVQPMYGQEGTAYIYSIYGMYYCLNAITVKKGEPQGVLIRAIEPLIGLDQISMNRTGKIYSKLNKKESKNLTSGPSKLCIAFDIDKKLNNTLLFDNVLYIVEKDDELIKLFEKKEDECGEIIASKRIGIDYAEEAKDYLYRFYYSQNPFVSKKDKEVIK